MSFTIRRNPLISVYLLSFFLTLHVAVPVYINSSFLETLTNAKSVGLIYTAASLLSVLALYLIPRLLKSIGDFRATLIFLALELAAFFGLATLKDPKILIMLFILSYTLIYLISFDLDIIVESFSRDSATGSIRGLYLTSANIAWVLAPTLAAGILTDGDYWRVYMAAAILLIPALVIFARKLEHFRDPRYNTAPFWSTARKVWRKRDVRNIVLSTFILNFFFTWMVIYTPLYLHEHLGFLWEDIGLMFSIMLVPFLLLEAPLGRLADKALGEKEILSLGFVVIAAATGIMSFVTEHAFLLWAALLFMTRVGAAMVEIMSETYFFKKVDGKDADIVSFQRSVRPLAGALGPLVATALLLFLPFKFLFLVLALIVLSGL
ncbi:MAG: MFS transporter, partial [Patescibacteria group bacterium]